MALLFDRLKVVGEPSGACALAAVLAGRIEGHGTQVAVVLSGRNVDLARFVELTTPRAVPPPEPPPAGG